jgi:regulator of protease activity HflC (stomatin/prohibitin superfamily)
MDRGLQALMRALRVLFFGLRILMIAVLVFVVFGGVFYVKEHEEAMLFHFGRLVAKGDADSPNPEILVSGEWYWAWPYPIDVVKRIPAQRSETVETRQFWLTENQLGLDAAAVGGLYQGTLKPGQGGYLLTGDANIMHMVWSATYLIRDAKSYYLRFFEDNMPSGTGERPDWTELRGVRKVVESLLSQSVLLEVAGWSVEDILTLSRRDEVGTSVQVQSLSNAVRDRLMARADELGLGIDIQQVSLLEVQPPTATRDAFREVVDSAQERQTIIDKAAAYERRVVAEAEGEASRIIAEANEYRNSIEKSLQADVDYIDRIVSEYTKNPESMLVALYTDALREVMERVQKKFVVRSRESGGQEIRLLLSPVPPKPQEAVDELTPEEQLERDLVRPVMPGPPPPET